MCVSILTVINLRQRYQTGIVAKLIIVKLALFNVSGWNLSYISTIVFEVSVQPVLVLICILVSRWRTGLILIILLVISTPLVLTRLLLLIVTTRVLILLLWL